jgi:hypothetical protein
MFRAFPARSGKLHEPLFRIERVVNGFRGDHRANGFGSNFYRLANLDGRARSSVRVTFISRFASAGRFCIRRKSTGTFGNRARWQVVASMRLGLRIDPAR